MPFAVIEGGIFGAKVVGYGIARRKPPAHFLYAGTTLGGGFVSRGVCCFGSCGKVRASFSAFFIK